MNERKLLIIPPSFEAKEFIILLNFKVKSEFHE